jgi:hypothetical protein
VFASAQDWSVAMTKSLNMSPFPAVFCTLVDMPTESDQINPLPCNDQGSKFIGWAFQHMLTQYDIQHWPTTVKNLQANAICKRMHQAVGNSLRVLKQWTPPNHLDDAHLLVDAALANTMYATHATFHSWLMTTPGALNFGHDMVMNIPLITDLTLIPNNRQRLIDECAICSNAHHHSYDYQPGQEVLKLVYKPDKLEPCAQGLYDIIAVHTNGTLSIQSSHNRAHFYQKC